MNGLTAKAAWLAAAWNGGAIHVGELADAIDAEPGLLDVLPAHGVGLTEGEDYEDAVDDLAVQAEIDEWRILLVIDRDHALIKNDDRGDPESRVIGHTFVRRGDARPEFRRRRPEAPTEAIRAGEDGEVRFEGDDPLPKSLRVEGDALFTRFDGRMPERLAVDGDLCVDLDAAVRLPEGVEVGGSLSFLQSLACTGEAVVGRIFVGGDVMLPDPEQWRVRFREGSSVGGRVVTSDGSECPLPTAPALPTYWPLSGRVYEALSATTGYGRSRYDSRTLRVAKDIDFAATFGAEAAFLYEYRLPRIVAYEAADGTVLWTDSEDWELTVVPPGEWPSWAVWLAHSLGVEDGLDVSHELAAFQGWLERHAPGTTILDHVPLAVFETLVERGQVDGEVEERVRAVCSAAAAVLAGRLCHMEPSDDGFEATLARFAANGGDTLRLRINSVTVDHSDGVAYVRLGGGSDPDILKVENGVVTQWRPPAPERKGYALVEPLVAKFEAARDAEEAARLINDIDALRAEVLPQIPLCGWGSNAVIPGIRTGAHVKMPEGFDFRDALEAGVVWCAKNGSCVVWEDGQYVATGLGSIVDWEAPAAPRI